ncbi:MAG TPA: hypothetical protein VIK03_04260, partial [Thermoleophilia bacterium]
APPAAKPSAAAEPAQEAAQPERPPQPETAGQVAPEPAPAAQPAPGPETAAAAPAQELTLERVKRAWELILQRVQAVRVPLYGFLRDGRPSALEGDALTVALPSEFALRNATQNDNADVLATAVEGVLGRRVTARFELASGAAAQAAAPAAPAAPSLPDFTDQIRAAQASLDAELLPDES